MRVKELIRALQRRFQQVSKGLNAKVYRYYYNDERGVPDAHDIDCVDITKDEDGSTAIIIM